MEYNIIKEYIKLLNNYYLEFFKIVLKNKYNKKVCEDFLDVYFNTRYYNETKYHKNTDIMARINKELVDVYSRYVADGEDKDTLKNIVALFGYIAYFDNIMDINNEAELINILISDDTIKVANKELCEKSLVLWHKRLKKAKDKFFDTIKSTDFSMIGKRVYRKINRAVLISNIKISNLYSEYAIETAFNTEIISEDKLLVLFILVSGELINNAILLDFSRKFVVDIPCTLWDKEKKLPRILNIIDNPLAKKLVLLNISYTDYLEHKDTIDNYIKKGYSFSVTIDEKFNGDYDRLVIFNSVFIDVNNEYYDGLIEQEHSYRIIKM